MMIKRNEVERNEVERKKMKKTYSLEFKQKAVELFFKKDIL